MEKQFMLNVDNKLNIHFKLDCQQETESGQIAAHERKLTCPMLEHKFRSAVVRVRFATFVPLLSLQPHPSARSQMNGLHDDQHHSLTNIDLLN